MVLSQQYFHIFEVWYKSIVDIYNNIFYIHIFLLIPFIKVHKVCVCVCVYNVIQGNKCYIMLALNPACFSLKIHRNWYATSDLLLSIFIAWRIFLFARLQIILGKSLKGYLKPFCANINHFNLSFIFIII